MKQLPRLLRRAALLTGIVGTVTPPITAHSAEYEVVKTITRLYTYTAVASTPTSADVIVQVDTPPSGCVAFWVDTNGTPGGKNTYALLLSAYHTQALVRIVAVDTQTWAGSSQPHCRIIAAALE